MERISKEKLVQNLELAIHCEVGRKGLQILLYGFLTRIPEPVSTAYVPLLGGVCVRTKGVERHPVKRRIAAGQRRDVHVRNGREMVAGLTAKRKVRTRIQCGGIIIL